MYREKDFMSGLWSAKIIEKLKLKGCGLINCQSRLGCIDSITKEIHQSIDEGLSATQVEASYSSYLKRTGPVQRKLCEMLLDR